MCFVQRNFKPVKIRFSCAIFFLRFHQKKGWKKKSKFHSRCWLQVACSTPFAFCFVTSATLAFDAELKQKENFLLITLLLYCEFSLCVLQRENFECDEWTQHRQHSMSEFSGHKRTSCERTASSLDKQNRKLFGICYSFLGFLEWLPSSLSIFFQAFQFAVLHTEVERQTSTNTCIHRWNILRVWSKFLRVVSHFIHIQIKLVDYIIRVQGNWQTVDRSWMSVAHDDDNDWKSQLMASKARWKKKI